MGNTITGNYWTFYLMGRGEKLLKHDIDVEAIAGELVAGGDLRSKIATVAATAGRPLEDGKTKRKWTAEHGDEAREAECTVDDAYRAWCQGRIDELAYSLESDVMEAIADDLGYDDEDGDDPEDDEEDDDDD